MSNKLKVYNLYLRDEDGKAIQEYIAVAKSPKSAREKVVAIVKAINPNDLIVWDITEDLITYGAVVL